MPPCLMYVSRVAMVQLVKYSLSLAVMKGELLFFWMALTHLSLASTASSRTAVKGVVVPEQSSRSSAMRSRSLDVSSLSWKVTSRNVLSAVVAGVSSEANAAVATRARLSMRMPSMVCGWFSSVVAIRVDLK